MKPVRKILAPVDLRTDCEFAVNHAVDVAREFGAELFLLSVTGTSGRGPLLWPPAAFRTSPFAPDSHRLIIPGPFAATVARYADFIDAGLVLASTRRYGSWNLLRGRSDTARLLAQSDRPFWLVRASNLKPRQQFRCRRIVAHVPLDGRDSSVLETAEAYANSCGASVTVVHVFPPDDEGLLAEGLRVRGDAPLSRAVAAARMAQVTRALRFPYNTQIERGNVAERLRSAVRGCAADLVITGRGPGATETAPVFRGLDCPVLSVALAVPEPQTALQCAFSGTSPQHDEALFAPARRR